MVTLAIDIQLDAATVPPPPALVTGWRCKYPSEGGNDNPDGMPAVTPSMFNGSKFGESVPFTKELQWLSWELMKEGNRQARLVDSSVGLMTTKHWRSVYYWDIAFTNKQGFGMPDDPRADFINNMDVTAELPKLMDGVICAGGLYQFNSYAGHLWATPGVHAIDASKPLPSVETIITRGWYFCATNNTRNPSHFAQGQGGQVWIPRVLLHECPYIEAYFQQWVADVRPNPLIKYL